MMITKETINLNSLDYQSGQTILIDKPVKWTSFKVVAQIRKIVAVKKVGHSGTLDPLATGLLIICTGKKTKDLNQFSVLNKTYTGSIILGQYSDTFDLEGEITSTPIPDSVNEKLIFETKEKFLGEIFQVPPMFSAKKLNGKRLYKIARKGKEVILEPRKVFIEEFEITSVNLPEIIFRITCSKGTYIRAIANDFGKELGTSAVLGSLRRTRIGDFDVTNALKVEEFVESFNPADTLKKSIN